MCYLRVPLVGFSIAPRLGLSQTNAEEFSEALPVTPVISCEDDIKSDSVMGTATKPARPG